MEFLLKKIKSKGFLLIFVIIFIASFLRFFNVSAHDPYTDEVLLGFRAIKMIDFDLSLVQTTPWQWVDTVPWWMHLSFHDHPILFFLMQNISISVFGETLFALRLPAVLSGIGSVFLIYLIGVKLKDKRFGYIAAALLAVQSYHVWVSRDGIQDGAVIFFSLLILWFWLKAINENKKPLWILWGVALGLGIITKLTILIITPILFVYALVYRQNIFLNKFFWYGALATVIFSSPIWLYNLALYKNFGHFDFQISALLNQYVEKWQFRQGRQMVGNLSNRLNFFFDVFNQSTSLFFRGLSILSIVYVVYLYIKNKSKLVLFLISVTLLQSLWFLVIGSTYRFGVMLIPYLVLLISYSFVKLFEYVKYKNIIYLFLFLFIASEIFFTVNSFFIFPSIGKKNITYAQINEEARIFGFNEIDNYLDKELSNKVSAAFGAPTYQFLVDLHNEEIKDAKEKNRKLYSLVIIYDSDFNFLSRAWVFQRRLIYRGWPAMPDTDFFEITGDRWDEYYREQGIEHFLYFTGVEGADFDAHHLYSPYKPKVEKTEFEKYLQGKGVEFEYIENKLGQKAFKAYKF